MNYSQNGTEQILAEILGLIKSEVPHVCCEIGAADGIWLSNTAQLVREQGWRGTFVEADHAQFLKCCENYKHLPATVICDRATVENINALVPEGCGFLSIDVDGNDYWLWQALTSRPNIVCIEYNNHKTAADEVHPYDPEFVRPLETYYYGASREALIQLGESKGYRFSMDDGNCNLFFAYGEWKPA